MIGSIKNFLKNIKLNRFKRLIILILTGVFAIITITFGSILFVSKKGELSTEYGGGAEFIVKIEPEKTNNKIEESNRIASDVAQEIYNRVDSLGVKGVQVHPETSSDGARVRVTYPGLTNTEERKEIEDLITHKPKLSFTDIHGNLLFDEYQNFNEELVNSNGKIIPLSSKSNVPIKSGSASPSFTRVNLKIVNGKTAEWTKATKYISSLKDNSNRIFVWLDLDKFVQKMKIDWPKIWLNSGENPIVASKISVKKDGKDIFANRKYTIDSSKYLISSPSVKETLSGTDFVIEGMQNSTESKELSRKINYGSSDYRLNLEYSNYVEASYGANAFDKAMTAGIIVFAFIVLFLIFNYGILGILSSFSMALYIFMTLTIFTLMRGQYSPESIAALIIGIGMCLDANIITFERLKNEVYGGVNLKNGLKNANKKSTSTIFDSNITTLIVALVLFFFGTRNIIGLSVTLILSIILTLFIMLGFTKFTSRMLVNTGIFDKRLHLLGFKPKFDTKIQNKINKFNFVKNSKWFNLVSLLIIAISWIVFVTNALNDSSFTGGLNLSHDFTGGTNILIIPKEGIDFITSSDAEAIRLDLIDRGLDGNNIEFIKESEKIVSIKYNSVKTFADANIFKQVFENKFDDIQFIQSITTNDVANKILFNALMGVGIAIIGVIVYTLFRFKWTYSIAAIAALIHDSLIVVALFIMFRIEISPIFIAGILAIIGYSINDTIVIFDRLREKLNDYEGNLTPEKIKELSDTSIKETFKRSILTSFTTIMAVLILMSFGNATKFSFNIAMFFGLLAGTYSSIFIATFVWTKLEIFRQKRISLRKNKNFWDSDENEEQIFKDINDFSV